MKKISKIYLAMLLAVVLVFAAACSSNKEEDPASVSGTDPNVEQEADEEKDAPEVETEDDEANKEDAESETAEPQLEQSEPTEQDQAIIDDMEKEDGVENAVAYVTDDKFVLVTFEMEENTSADRAEQLANEYGEKLSKEYADYTISIEVMDNEGNLLEAVDIDPAE